MTPRNGHSRRRGFTMLELLVSTSVLIVLLGLLVSALTQSGDVFDLGSNRIRLMTAGRAAFGVIGDDLANAFQTNLVSLVDADAYAEDWDGDGYATFASTNSTAAFYRIPSSMREGCYPLEYVEYVVSNRSDNVPVLLRRSFRFLVENPESPAEEHAWESEAEAPDSEFPESETGLKTIATATEILEGVASVNFLPWSTREDGDSESLDEDTPPEVVDVYVELLTREQCKRAAKIKDEAKQKSFVSRNVVRMARRVAIKNHPSFNIPENLVPWWALGDSDEDGTAGGDGE